METRPLFIWLLFSAVTSVYAIALTKVVQAPRSNSITGGNVEISSAPNTQVNISNVWTLPEEGYPVFYRYFRDRVTWFEADAVCQFHHAQLITVDSNIQFDAMRAFLKELDVSNNVWIGLRQSKPYGELVWTDFKPLTNQEHWHEPIQQSESTVCVASDPAADFRWHGFNCGGPEVASFICEIPVPDWAQRDGCLPTALPSLTVTYLPEQSAVELISDCGLDGSRRVTCQGHRSREAIMRELSCESATESPADENGITLGSDLNTRHRRDTVQPSEATTTASVTSAPTTKPVPTKTPTKATAETTKTTKTMTKAPAETTTTTATATKVVSAPTTVAAKIEKPVESVKTKVADISGSLDPPEDGKDSSEAPQEMSIAEEPIKVRAQEVNNTEFGDIDQINIENKSIEIDSANSNSVQKVTESFTVLKPDHWLIGSNNDKISLASEESIEDLHNTKGSIKNMVLNTTAHTANNNTKTNLETSKPVVPPVVLQMPTSSVKPTDYETTLSPEELQRRKEAILAHIFVTPPSTKARDPTILPKISSTHDVVIKTLGLDETPKLPTIIPTPSHMKEESHEIFGEKPSRKVKKTILGSKLNSFDVTTITPKHENAIQTTSNRFICKNLPPVLLYDKNENEQRQVEQVLTPGGIETTQYSTTPEEVHHADKTKKEGKPLKSEHARLTISTSQSDEITSVIVEAGDQKIATEKSSTMESSNVDPGTVASTAKIEISSVKPTFTAIQPTKKDPVLRPKSSVPAVSTTNPSSESGSKPTTVVFSSELDMSSSAETTTKLSDKSQRLMSAKKKSLEATSPQKKSIEAAKYNDKKSSEATTFSEKKSSMQTTFTEKKSSEPTPSTEKKSSEATSTEKKSSETMASPERKASEATPVETKPSEAMTYSEKKSSEAVMSIGDKFSEKTTFTENKSSEEMSTTEKPSHHGFLEATDTDVPERPNRGRLLIHPQHHSFYPYFLNRVLG